MIYTRRFRRGDGRREWLAHEQANGGQRRDGTDIKSCPKDAFFVPVCFAVPSAAENRRSPLLSGQRLITIVVT